MGKIPEHRPRWWFKGKEPGGGKQWALPPDPATGQYVPVGLRDWLRRPELWKKRAVSKIGGCGVDTTHMLRRNFRKNIGCDISKTCLGCREYCDGLTEKDEMEPLHPYCRRWQQEGKDWKNLWGKEKGKIALVCAVGPHLMEQRDEVTELMKDRDKYFSIGFSRALFSGPLDYYTSLERRPPARFDPAKHRFPNTTFIGATSVYPGLAEAFKKGNRYFGEGFTTISEEGRFLDSGMERMTIVLGNICPDTLLMAHKLGAKELWLYGHEFCCTVCEASEETPGAPKGEKIVDKYYFDMSVRSSHLNFYGLTHTKYFPFIGVDGEEYATSYDLTAASMNCEATCDMLQENGTKIVDKTKKGNFWWSHEEPEITKLKARVKELEAKND